MHPDPPDCASKTFVLLKMSDKYLTRYGQGSIPQKYTSVKTNNYNIPNFLKTSP